MNKHILVTGGAGFIGSCFVEYALSQGHQVLVLDKLTYAGNLVNLIHVNDHPGYRFFRGDICDGALVLRLLNEYNIDAIVHMAAESHVDNSISSPSAFIETNMIGTYTMLESARQYWLSLDNKRRDQLRMVYVSTDEVFGSLGESGIFTESSPIQPNSPYSASKAGGDLLARAWFHTYGMPVITTHCSNNYGLRQHPEKLIPKMISRALSKQALTVYGDGKNIRDWIHVEDHCQGIYLALMRGVAGETYGFGGNCERQNNQVVSAICAMLDRIKPNEDGSSYAALIHHVDDRLGHDRRYALASSKAERDLGYQNRYASLEAGLEQTVRWYLDNQEWCRTILQSSGE
ncbi:MAG: dTDP-glucose 4,6-dehydratase [Alphaproteobacteria bacterium]|nr:dTDP-glucose 4,6-dehydratase [Alphaproteobacteria bacterium]